MSTVNRLFYFTGKIFDMPVLEKAFKKLSSGKIGHSPPAGGGIRPLPRPVIGYTKAPAMPASGNVLPLPLAPYTADERRRQSNYPLHSPNNHKF